MLFTSNVQSVEIKSTIDVKLIKQKDEITYNEKNPFVYKAIIKQRIFLENYSKDTLIISLNNNSFEDKMLKDLYFRNMSIFSSSKRKGETNDYYFDGVDLYIVLDSNTFDLTIEYEYFSKYNVYFLNEGVFFIIR